MSETDQAVAPPARLTAGDTWRWTVTLADHPADDGWTLTYTLARATEKETVVAAADGADHAVTVAGGTTAGMAAGAWQWWASVEKGGERTTLATGRLTVDPDPAAVTDVDALTYWETLLAATRATLTDKATDDQASLEYRGVKLSRMPLADVIRLEALAREHVARLKAAAVFEGQGLAPPTRIVTRFR